jgi:polyribonucleotide nucleotidyltransferase
VLAKVEKRIAGRNLVLESGKLARQAHGAVKVTYGETVVLCTAVAEAMENPPGFFPMTIDYREKQYAAGKFPGGVIKREGRPTTKEILTMRMVDRPIRPLFPDDYCEEVQIAAVVLSADKENDPDIVSLLGASAALLISDIPWDGPVAGCRMGLVDDEFIVNPTTDERSQSEMEMVVAGTRDAVIMVEGNANIIPEDDVLTAINLAQDVNVEITELMMELKDKCGKPTREYVAIPSLDPVIEQVRSKYADKISEASNTAVKMERKKAMAAVRQEAIKDLCKEDAPEAPTKDELKGAFEKVEAEVMRRQIVEKGVRYDGRSPDEVRHIECEVGVLPRTHGAALFTRGETQTLVVATLGTVEDEQRVLDALVEEEPKKFMLHYNFPGWCVGEAWQPRGPKRREIGHGQLAEHALKPVLPSAEDFPYTIRLVSDVLESNGSSSMASVCGGTLSLMDAGVPISDPVAGVAMGVIEEGDKQIILTDIAGTEDHFGDMDFKVAGTQKGVTALQLDVKMKGLSSDLLARGLERAREARLDILKIMLQTLRQPRESVSRYAPRIHQIMIDPDTIGALIGPGGKTIRSLEEKFECSIEVEDDGAVTLSAGADSPDVNFDEIADYIKMLTMGKVEVGKIYQGKVSQIREFGAIVEIFPGTDGLCHISELADEYVDDVEDICKVGDTIPVKVLAVDGNRVKLSRKAAMDSEK